MFKCYNFGMFYVLFLRNSYLYLSLILKWIICFLLTLCLYYFLSLTHKSVVLMLSPKSLEFSLLFYFLFCIFLNYMVSVSQILLLDQFCYWDCSFLFSLLNFSALGFLFDFFQKLFRFLLNFLLLPSSSWFFFLYNLWRFVELL